MTKVGEVLARVREILATRQDLVQRGTVSTEAEQILEAAIADTPVQPLSRSQLFERIHDPIGREQEGRALSIAQKRAQGTLLQHILGYQFFFDHFYEVSPEVLVPRPETEVLVEEVSRLLIGRELTGLEIGLGSGAISVELLSRFSRLKMIATEVSDQAAVLAARNAKKILGPGSAERLKIVMSESSDQIWPTSLPTGRIDFIVSNPPYLQKSEAEAEVLKQEPALALFAPEGDPLFYYRGLAEAPFEVGFIAVEIPHERDQAILELFEKLGWRARLLPDLSNRSRVLIAEKAKRS